MAASVSVHNGAFLYIFYLFVHKNRAKFKYIFNYPSIIDLRLVLKATMYYLSKEIATMTNSVNSVSFRRFS